MGLVIRCLVLGRCCGWVGVRHEMNDGKRRSDDKTNQFFSSTATAMSATSDWVTPPTRPGLIESLVSGVGLCEFEAFLLQ
jgi:hypothetical protein